MSCASRGVPSPKNLVNVYLYRPQTRRGEGLQAVLSRHGEGKGAPRRVQCRGLLWLGPGV